MPRPTKTLLETITDKASGSFGKTVTPENYGEWFDHWIATGEQWKGELLSENLVETAKVVQGHIDWERRNQWHIRG